MTGHILPFGQVLFCGLITMVTRSGRSQTSNYNTVTLGVTLPDPTDAGVIFGTICFS